MKYFVVDTNVLIHSPKSLTSFEDNTVVVPFPVIEELDKLKRGYEEKSQHVRNTIRFISKLGKTGSLYDGVEIGNGGILKILYHKTSLLPSSLDPNIVDNQIISVAYFLMKEGKETVFISKDLNARIKAQVLGIKSEDFEKEVINLESFHRGYREISLDFENITRLHNHKEISHFQEIIPNDLLENEFVFLTSGGSKPLTALGRVQKSLNSITKVEEDKKEVWGISPKSKEQQFAFNALFDPKIHLVTLTGIAGTGKTLISLAAGLNQTLDERLYNKVLVSRPVIPLGKDIGFLPGDKDEKMKHWMQPIFDNLEFLFDKSDNKESIEHIIERNWIEIEAMTYIRGRSLSNKFILVDEAQNLTPHEVKTIISRAGDGTKIVLCGDIQQIDNPYLDERSNGLSYLVDKMKGNSLYAHVHLRKSERSQLASLAAKIL